MTRDDEHVPTSEERERKRARSADAGVTQNAEARPAVTHDVHTDDLPATPQRDYLIPATRWLEAPAELLALGADIGVDLVAYKRRIGRYLLWRAGPAVRADARYMALSADDLATRFTFRLFADGTGEGLGPDGVVHHRFRAWKEALRDAGREPSGTTGRPEHRQPQSG